MSVHEQRHKICSKACGTLADSLDLTLYCPKYHLNQTLFSFHSPYWTISFLCLPVLILCSFSHSLKSPMLIRFRLKLISAIQGLSPHPAAKFLCMFAFACVRACFHAFLHPCECVFVCACICVCFLYSCPVLARWLSCVSSRFWFHWDQTVEAVVLV